MTFFQTYNHDRYVKISNFNLSIQIDELMAPKSDNFIAYPNSKSCRRYRNSLTTSDTIHLPVATIFDNLTNDSVIQIDHSYTNNDDLTDDNDLMISEDVEGVYELDSFDHLIIPFHNRLMTIHQENERIYPEVNSYDHNVAAAAGPSTVIIRQNVVNSTPDRSPRAVHLFQMEAGEYFSEVNSLENEGDSEKFAMILTSDFFQNKPRNLDILKGIVEQIDPIENYKFGENTFTCDEFGHPEVIGCDPFLCTSRQVFDLCLDHNESVSSLDDFFKKVNLETLSDLKADEFYISFIFFPVDSRDSLADPLITSFIPIDDMYRPDELVITFDYQHAEPKRYQVFTLLAEITKTDADNSKELILHQGPLLMSKAPMITLL